MTVFHCEKLFYQNGWVERFIETGSDGTIRNISTTNVSGPMTHLSGYVIPGFQNGHSHSFQYAMGGVAEYLPANAAHDDFWTWREAMYNLALSVSPDQIEAISAMLYSEMLRNGTTHVVEFHYLHNDINGNRYSDDAEISKRIIRAAETAGIELTLVPVFYHHGGFGKPAEPKQRRFISSSVESYLKLIESVQGACKSSPDALCGIGVHSLRAGSQRHIKDIIASTADGPFHIHISEQQKEIDDCVQFYGKRPVEWVLDNFDVNSRFNFTHATHMNDGETIRLAKSGANVIICPSTEGNLGDGFFNLLDYRHAGGHYTIGSDSHIGLSPMEDLRWLDYVQRLLQQKRNVICSAPMQDSAQMLLSESWRGGRRTRGDFRNEFFEVGAPFDCVVIDPEHPSLIGKPAERALSAFVYAGDCTAIAKVIRRGTTIVEKGMHAAWEKIRKSYRKAVQDINSR